MPHSSNTRLRRGLGVPAPRILAAEPPREGRQTQVVVEVLRRVHGARFRLELPLDGRRESLGAADVHGEGDPFRRSAGNEVLEVLPGCHHALFPAFSPTQWSHLHPIGTNDVVEVLLAVVVGQLLARLDVAAGVDEDFLSPCARLAVRPAGVVDVAADVLPARPVDDPPRVHLEEVAAALAVRLLGREKPAGVLHHELSLREGDPREQAQPGRRSS